MRATFTTFMDVSATKIELERQSSACRGNLHEGHAVDVLQQGIENSISLSGWKALAHGGAPPKSLSSVLADYSAWQQQMKQRRGLTCPGKTVVVPASSPTKLSGRGSREFEPEYVNDDSADAELMADLSAQLAPEAQDSDKIGDAFSELGLAADDEDEAPQEDESTGERISDCVHAWCLAAFCAALADCQIVHVGEFRDSLFLTGVLRMVVNYDWLVILGDWLQYYKDLLPPSKLWEGKSKGRTLRAMALRASKLMGSRTTREVGALLRDYHDDMKIFHEFRGFKVDEGVTTDELRCRLEIVLKYKTTLPAPLAEAWLAKDASRFRAEQKWREYLVAVDPYSKPAQFSLESPRLSDTPRLFAYKCLAFRAELFRETLSPLMYDEKNKVGTVVQLVDAAQSQLGNVGGFGPRRAWWPRPPRGRGCAQGCRMRGEAFLVSRRPRRAQGGF